MAYQTIDPNTIKVGDPVTKEILNLIKANFDDHEERLSTLAGGSGKIIFFNELILIRDYKISDLDGVVYFEVANDCIITECSLQIFGKNGITVGIAEVDIKKNNSTNNSGFNSILTNTPKVNFATDADYSKKFGVINNSLQAFVAGDILRLDILSLPEGIDKIKFHARGEF